MSIIEKNDELDTELYSKLLAELDDKLRLEINK